MQRLAVIGLDAVEPQFAERLMAEGKLPTLARLKRASARCDLHSEATWRSGRVWETLLTGTADFPSAEPLRHEGISQLATRRTQADTVLCRRARRQHAGDRRAVHVALVRRARSADRLGRARRGLSAGFAAGGPAH